MPPHAPENQRALSFEGSTEEVLRYTIVAKVKFRGQFHFSCLRCAGFYFFSELVMDRICLVVKVESDWDRRPHFVGPLKTRAALWHETPRDCVRAGHPLNTPPRSKTVDRTFFSCMSEPTQTRIRSVSRVCFLLANGA